jgi:hypothetical protein
VFIVHCESKQTCLLLCEPFALSNKNIPINNQLIDLLFSTTATCTKASNEWYQNNARGKTGDMTHPVDGDAVIV